MLMLKLILILILRIRQAGSTFKIKSSIHNPITSLKIKHIIVMNIKASVDIDIDIEGISVPHGGGEMAEINPVLRAITSSGKAAALFTGKGHGSQVRMGARMANSGRSADRRGVA